jgi:hypothetical protein
MIGKCEPILNSIYGGGTRGTLMSDIRTLDSNINPIFEDDAIEQDLDEEKLKPLDPETYNALVTFSSTKDGCGWTPRKDALLHTRYRIRGLQYTRSTAGKKDSVIFFQPKAGGPLVPGVIRQIFSLPRVNPEGNKTRGILLAVQRYKSLADIDHIRDPFKRFTDFGAGLWHEKMDRLEIITTTQKICHAIWRQWEDKILVMRPLNRVSHIE